MKLYKTTEKLSSPNYPYGYSMRTIKYDWIEFKDGKGFRHVSMTINPKTGKENKPKAGTYCDMMVLGKDETTNYTHSKAWSFYADEDIDGIITFLSDPDNFALFTPEQIAYLYRRMIVWCKTSIVAQCQYCGSDPDDLFPLFKPQIEILVRGLKNGGNEFMCLTFDWKKINSYKVEGYQPFKVVNYGIKRSNA